jgi:23S rRNA (uracil1939-C5)-methyltransferase
MRRGVKFRVKEKIAERSFVLKTGDITQIEIEKIIFGGDGLGHIDGKICFVPDTLPGETVSVEIKKVKNDYLTAKPVEVINKSPHRVQHMCQHAGRCPGCNYQHMDYNMENRIKNEHMKQFLAHNIPVDNTEFADFEAPVSPYNYRNKLTLHVQKDGAETSVGYFSEDNQTVLDIDQCILARDQINEKIQDLRSDPGFNHTLRDGMTLTFRHTQHDGVVFWRNKPPRGMSWLKEELPCGQFSVPAGSFHQVSPDGCWSLIKTTMNILLQAPTDLVIDLYCGSGLFGVAAVNAGVKHVIGIEVDPEAAEAAKYNLRSHDCQSPRIITGDAGKNFKSIIGGIPASGLLIVDPPRGGLSAKVVKTITRSPLKRMIYVSCSPDTLGRDLKQLHEAGFELNFAKMVNMFPRTAHFETFTYLTRK